MSNLFPGENLSAPAFRVARSTGLPGPLALSDSIATGRAILAAQAMGADLAYIGSAFIATNEANAVDDYKDMIVERSADAIVYSSLFTGAGDNYLRPLTIRAGMDAANLPESDPSKMDFGSGRNQDVKVWRDIWGSGQGIGAINKREPAGQFIERLKQEYAAAQADLGARRLLPFAISTP